MRHRSHLRPGDPGLAAHLRREIEGEVWFDPASRGRYSTDASIYQIEPIGVVAPRSAEDIALTIAICREAGAPVLPRGAGTSQCGQAVGEAVVVGTSRHHARVGRFNEEARRVTVEPGIVLDGLNAWLKPKGLFFPVDVSPANRATIGGMAGNNSCGSRSIRYGNMVHNVHAISAILADGSAVRFGEVSGNLAGVSGDDHYSDLIRRMRALGAREADEIARRFPVLLRRVGGYNIDTIRGAGHNMASLLVGSEGTLGFFTALELDLQRSLVCMCGSPGCGKKILAECTCAEASVTRAELRNLVAEGLTRDEVLRFYIDKHQSQEALAAPLDEGFNRLAWLFPYFLAATGAVALGAALVRWTRPGQPAGDDGRDADPDRDRLEARLDDELRDLD